MASPEQRDPALEADWLGVCRRAAEGVRRSLDRHPLTADRSPTLGRGEGGDPTLVIDRAAEDAIFEELEATGLSFTAVSEERGEVPLAGGGPVHVVVDPIDGSRNAKRRLPLYSVSIAVAEGPRVGDVVFGYVHDFAIREEWWAYRGGGAFLNGDRLPPLEDGELEMLGLETARPDLVASASEALAATGASRLRAIGSIALSLCWVAAARFDAMVTLGSCRSVDLAAGQLVVREVGGAVALPDAASDPLEAPLSLDMRSRALAASRPELMDGLRDVGRSDRPERP